MAVFRLTYQVIFPKPTGCNSIIFAKTINEFSIANSFRMAKKYLSSIQVNKNLTLISGEPKNATVKQLKLSAVQTNPLLIMPSWLMARRKHINKYAEVYIKRGFDVLTISISPWQLFWPTKGAQVVAADILHFLEHNYQQSPMVIHGFSVGGYIWGEVMVRMAAEEQRYKPIIDRVQGQVWDSAADITEIPTGLPIAVFPHNKVMQSTLRQYVIYHMKTFDKVATCHYVRSSQMFHTNIIRAPALFFLSKNDPIGAEGSNMRVRENWENMGIKVTWQCWDKSPHVGHMHRHPEEYLGKLDNFLNKLPMTVATPQAKNINNEQRQMKAKL